MRAEDNRKLTETGPGTPGGSWMRLYWQPVALSEELDTERAVVPVRVLGKDLEQRLVAAGGNPETLLADTDQSES
jgi:hypothetical protein